MFIWMTIGTKTPQKRFSFPLYSQVKGSSWLWFKRFGPDLLFPLNMMAYKAVYSKFRIKLEHLLDFLACGFCQLLKSCYIVQRYVSSPRCLYLHAKFCDS